MTILVCALCTSGSAQLQEIWRARYSGPDGNDRASNFTIDGAGNVYVTGRSLGTNRYYHITTVKFSSSGQQVWAARYDETGTNYYEANLVRVDAETNVYVLATQGSYFLGDSDFALLKYDPQGNFLWSATYDGPDRNANQPSGMVLDAAGNIYVAGYAKDTNSGNFQTITLKFGPSGNLLWASRFASCGGATRIEFDSSGHLRVSFAPCESSVLGFVRYDTDGNELSVTRFASSPPTGPSNWVFDRDENLTWCARLSAGFYLGGWATVKFDPSGKQLWFSYQPTEPTDRFSGGPNGIALDSSGNVLVAGTFADQCVFECDGGGDIFTVKCDPNGRNLWRSRFSYDPDGYYFSDFGVNLITDEAGKAYVIGQFGVESLWSNGGVLQMDAAGNTLWSSLLDTHESTALDLAFDPSGNLIVVAKEDYLVIKFARTNVSNLPVIESPPHSVALVPGATNVLAVSVSGRGPFTYRWFRNGDYTTPRTNATKSVSGRNPGDDYYVSVANSNGVVYSASARVSLLPVLSAAARLPDGRMRFTASGEQNLYTVEASTNLLQWASVTNVFGSSFDFTNSLSDAAPIFYRVSRQP